MMVKPKRKGVSFNDEEEVINPEDVDSSVGRFRNLIQSTVFIPNKVGFFKKLIYLLSEISSKRGDILHDLAHFMFQAVF
jgi:hypothetical protein